MRPSYERSCKFYKMFMMLEYRDFIVQSIEDSVIREQSPQQAMKSLKSVFRDTLQNVASSSLKPIHVE